MCKLINVVFSFSFSGFLNSVKEVIITIFYNPIIIHFSVGGSFKSWCYLCDVMFKSKNNVMLNKQILFSNISFGQPVKQDNFNKFLLVCEFYFFSRFFL